MIKFEFCIFSSVHEQSDDTGEDSSTMAATSVSADNVVGVDKKDHVDSPNLLTIGLSKKTLGQLGFKFKEDLSAQGSRQVEEKKGKSEPKKLGNLHFHT